MKISWLVTSSDYVIWIYSIENIFSRKYFDTKLIQHMVYIIILYKSNDSSVVS